MRVFLFVILFIFSTHAFAEMQFLKLEGSAPGIKNGALMQEMKDTLIAPLLQNPDIALFTYVINMSGDGQFHFVAEPTHDESPEAFNQYITKFRSQSFHGVRIHFQTVSKIYEVTTVQAGNYVDDEDDAFKVSFEISQTQTFGSLLGWKNFTDTYGYALLTPDHAAFKSYLTAFVSDPGDFAAISKALSTSNMMAIDPRVYLVLDDQTVVDGDMAHSPFIPFRFIRNCYEARLENGFCF